jgi:ubiquinone/menaquinone biosynthesis C-methylase UbiE
MTLHEAIDLIRPGITPNSGTWADIGAGTGLFTSALLKILTEGKVIALDKSPHALYKIENPNSKLEYEIMEGDFNLPLDLPPLDGIIMANSLHYAHDHLVALKNVLRSLKSNGKFILIEYETNKPNPPWVPNPVPFRRFQELSKMVGLNEPALIGARRSIYSDGRMYVATTSLRGTSTTNGFL